MNREETIFEQALGIDSPAARETYLREACAGNDPLFESLQALLKVHDRVGKFMDPAAQAQLKPSMAALLNGGPPAIQEKPGDRIGRYKLLEKIGEGGCGVVYMGEQEEPVRRRVALKVIKLGMDTEAVIARFEAERQALAMMDHPNIAKVLDAGTTESSAKSEIRNPKSEIQAGRPYFVMELVRGVKITEYCDHNNLTTPQRLDLFMQVCRAIQHAHQKGIIHRDIKPSNILVTLHDGVPLPKVIDFGIAKATQGRLTDKTVFTAFHQFIGTPAYMSPEQAEMSCLDIDTRSDIYSLGVLLYELLTGKTPFDSKELLEAGLDAMRRTIREQEPARPSTKLSTMVAGELTITANRRRTEPPKLVHAVRGDLDWIVMKALDKDRARRYETSNGFAMDLQRHLDNEPVIARPPSRLYRFQKSVQRNKLAFAAVGGVLAALMMGLTVSTAMFFREKAARERAVTAEHEQARLRHQAEIEAAEGRQEATFLANLGETLRQQQNLVESESSYRESLAMWKRLFGNEHQLTDWALIGLSYVLENEGKFAEAEALTRGALASARKSSTKDPVRVEFLVAALANVLRFQSDYAEAEILNREALASARQFATNDPARLALRMADVADILRRQGKYAEAEPFFRDAVEAYRKLADKGDVHELNRLAWLLATCAVPGTRDGRSAVEFAAKAVTATNRKNAAYLDTLAAAYAETGQFEKAASVQKEAIALLQNENEKADYASRMRLYEASKPFHQSGEESLAQTASYLLKSGKFPEAEKPARECLLILEQAKPDDWLMFYARSMLGGALLGQKKYADGEPLLLSGYEGMKQREDKIPPLGKPRLKEAMQRLVDLYKATDRPDQAAEWKMKLAEFEKAEGEKKAQRSGP